MEVFNIYKIRENSIINLHMPITQIQLISIWSFLFHLYCDLHVLSLPIELFLKYIKNNDITSPLNISVYISTRQGHYFLNHCYSPLKLRLFFKYHSICSQYSTFPYCSVIFFKNWFVCISIQIKFTSCICCFIELLICNNFLL